MDELAYFKATCAIEEIIKASQNMPKEENETLAYKIFMLLKVVVRNAC